MRDVLVDRRHFLLGSGAALLASGCDRGPATSPARDGEPPVSLLQTSPFVYVSPLDSEGKESRCHGEIWFGWIDGAVVMAVNHAGWKARAIRKGWSHARVWVGDYGTWRKRVLGLELTNGRFRAGPSFMARGEITTADALFAQLMAVYETKYFPAEPDYRERFPRWHGDGTNVMIRYRPAAPTA